MKNPSSENGGDLFRHLMDTAPVMIWASGPDKLCTWFNQPWLEFTGRTMEQELGEGWVEGVHPQDLKRCLEIYVSHFDRRAPFRMEYRLRRADGEYRWILDTGVPRLDQGGAFLGYIGCCLDVTATRERELDVEIAAAERADAVVQEQRQNAFGRIAGGFGLEFNNLLTTLGGCLSSILEHSDSPEIVRRHAAAAETAVLQGGKLVGRLLAAGRQERFRAEMVHVNRLVAETRDMLCQASGDRISVETRLAAETDDTIIDPDQLEAALVNLVTNARDAMDGGGVVTIETSNVTVRPESIDEPDLAPGRYVMLAVRDTGRGMSGAVLRRAFEPFFTTKEIGRGTGLGLSQVRGMAIQSGGAARIASLPGRGTTIRLYLPCTAGGAG